MGLGSIPRIIRDYVHKRDKEKCRICGRYVNGKGQIHHIFRRNATIPPEYGIPWIPRNNHPDNLILLCNECHAKIHNGKIPNEHRAWIEANKSLRRRYEFPEELKRWLDDNTVSAQPQI